MSASRQLLLSRRFLPMFCTQFLGAFNDNVFKQSLILLLTFAAAHQLSLSLSLLNNLAALLFILPYFLFSSTAGQLADKYDRAWLTRWIKILEITIMLLATVGFLLHAFWLLFVALFLMGTHSTFFGPIKYAYLPQALHTDELVTGNALFQSGTSVAILTGMMLGGVLLQSTDPTAMAWTSATVLTVAVAGYLAARQIPPLAPAQPELRIDWNLWRTSVQTLRVAATQRRVLFSIVGISWFWFFGATLLTQIPELCKTLLHGDATLVTALLTLFTIGVAGGSLLGRWIGGHQVHLKLVPVGLAGLSLFALDLGRLLLHLPHSLPTVSSLLQSVTGLHLLVALLGIGVSGGLYIVPLYSFMQAHAPEAVKARVVAANNILNALFMVLSAVFAMLVLGVLKSPLPVLFLLTAGLNVLLGAWILSGTREAVPLPGQPD